MKAPRLPPLDSRYFQTFLARKLNETREVTRFVPAGLESFRGFLWESRVTGQQCRRVSYLLKAISQLQHAGYDLPDGERESSRQTKS